MADGRRKNGGKRSNAGRKSKAEELGLIALLEECFTLADRKKVLLALVKEAKRAPQVNMEAAKLLLAYTYGKPKESVEIDGKLKHEVALIPGKMALEEWNAQGWAQDKKDD